MNRWLARILGFILVLIFTMLLMNLYSTLKKLSVEQQRTTHRPARG